MYGPFSAAYPGNSVGAVVDYVTRMPTRFEAHAQVGATVQPFELYNTRATYRSWQASASLGDRASDWSWWVNVHRTDSEGQPLTFATRLASAGSAGAAGTPASGAVAGLNSAALPWSILGAGTQYHTVQDHAKLKLAYDLSATLRASAVLALWRNDADGRSETYLRDAAGSPVYSGAVNLDGRAYTGAQALGGGDFPLTREHLLHTLQGLSLKQRSRGVFDWELSASRYDYASDDKRQNAAANPQPAAQTGGAGTLAQGAGTGWTALAFKGTWRPPEAAGRHVVDFGVQLDHYQLRYRTASIAGNYLADGPGALVSQVRGDTRLSSLWGQDMWHFAEDWKAVLGLRAERWDAENGRTDFSASSAQDFPARRAHHLSPKAALAWQWRPETVLKAALGRAVRMPTVAELYGATSTTNSQYINDPNLAPEKSWTAELSAEQDLRHGSARLTLFAETTRDALYSQTTFDASANRNISRVQNVGRIATTGVELAASHRDVLLRGLELSGSLTYTD